MPRRGRYCVTESSLLRLARRRSKSLSPLPVQMTTGRAWSARLGTNHWPASQSDQSLCQIRLAGEVRGHLDTIVVVDGDGASIEHDMMERAESQAILGGVWTTGRMPPNVSSLNANI